MSDLFTSTPAPTRIGQANGEFLAHLAAMPATKRRAVTPGQFPHASAALVESNAAFWRGAPVHAKPWAAAGG